MAMPYYMELINDILRVSFCVVLLIMLLRGVFCLYHVILWYYILTIVCIVVDHDSL